ncbi:lytic murein transglycosylase [Aquipseudomonas campi]
MFQPRLYSLLVGSALFLSACTAPPNAATAASPTAPVAAPTQSADPAASAAAAAAAAAAEPSISFEAWRDTFRNKALAHGVQPALFDRAFANVSVDDSVVKADRSQPEFTRPVWEYLDGAVSPLRVTKGKALLTQHSGILRSIEQRYGVDRQALVAIWGMESNFGQFMGDKSVIRSLATLAYEGRRPQFAEDQLLAALLILQQGDIQPERMLGSWAGAMGQTQFIPTTYNSHAVDFDGDGRRDIWTSSTDALASAAHYLQASGWQFGQPWGYEVALPSGFDYAHADADIRKPLNEWIALGVKVPAVAVRADERASLLLPAGHRGPAFLVFNNFRAILRYNNSSSYALAVGLLSERFDNGGQVLGSWPRNDLPLSRSERIELQERLAQKGLQPGAADSIIGANTRKAIRSYQQQLGWAADGYPNHELLKQLRN